MVIIFICERGMSGFIGAVATMDTVPMKPEHIAIPVIASMLTPAGTGWAENGFPIDHITGVAPVMGAVLKCPIAVNCT
jgi:hypothetical protein